MFQHLCDNCKMHYINIQIPVCTYQKLNSRNCNAVTRSRPGAVKLRSKLRDFGDKDDRPDRPKIAEKEIFCFDNSDDVSQHRRLVNKFQKSYCMNSIAQEFLHHDVSFDHVSKSQQQMLCVLDLNTAN